MFRTKDKMQQSRGYSWEFLVGVCHLFPQISTLLQTKKCNFSQPFLDQTSKIHARFQTWALGIKYVIFTYIRSQTNKFFKFIWNLHIQFLFLSYSFGMEAINFSYIPVVPSKTIPDSRLKWAKCIPVFRPKRCKTPPDGAAHTYMAFIREYPPE